jgi:chromosomal replication initiator protein
MTELKNSDLLKIVDQHCTTSPVTISFNSNPLNPDRILQAVCRLFSLTKADVLGSSREKNIALARQLTMWFYKHELDLSYPTIGRYFGNRDHTTVMHGCNKIEKMRHTDPKLSAKIRLIQDILRQNT